MSQATQIEKMRAFDNASDFDEWESHNCDYCLKGYDSNEDLVCPLQTALTMTVFGDGVKPDILRRIGFQVHNEQNAKLNERCRECQTEVLPDYGINPNQLKLF